MDLLLILCAILLMIVIALLMRIEKRLIEIARIQREATPVEVTRRLQSQDLESDLFKRFLDEDFSRAEMSEPEQRSEFKKWEVANG